MTRHRFEPARLLLGLLLLGTAVTYAMHALGEWEVPLWARVVLVPASLLAAAFVALATFAVRRMLRRRRTPARRPLGGMPVDELHDGCERLHEDDGGAEDHGGGKDHGGANDRDGTPDTQ